MRLVRLILILVLLPSVVAFAAPPVEEILSNTIAKIERDKQQCARYVHAAVTKSIKYDKKMLPDEVTTMTKRVYHLDERMSEQILTLEKDGELQSPDDIKKRVAEQNEKWNEEQKEGKGKKAASRDNYADPLSAANIGFYSYHLIETRDSSFVTVSAAVAGTNDIVDQSVQKLTTYYVVQARAKAADEKRLNATYWIDARTYGLLRSEFSPSKMPRFVEMLDFQLEYQIIQHGDSAMYLPRRFELKGKAGFLFFKGRFGVIEEYSDYHCVEAIDESLLSQRYFFKPEDGQKP